jgi:hypothetical protein
MVKASIRAASVRTTAMPHHDFDNRLNMKAFQSLDIAAEATSEYARGPSYDELWRDPRRPTQETPAMRRSRLPVVVAIISVILGAMALIALREKIVRIAPLSATFYSGIGLPVNLAGLELRSLKSQIVIDGVRKVLTIEGEIVNLRREANRVPPMALTVRGENGLDKYAWTEPAPKARLEPGETIAFRARLASPPPDGANVLVRFASAEPRRSHSKTLRVDRRVD